MRNLKSIVTYLHSKLLNETLESSQNKSLSFVNSSYNAVLFDINNNKNTNINKNFNNNNNRMKFNHHQKSVDLKKINFNNLLISKLNKFNNSASKRGNHLAPLKILLLSFSFISIFLLQMHLKFSLQP